MMHAPDICPPGRNCILHRDSGGVGHTLEEMHAIDQERAELGELRLRRREAGRRPVNLMKEPIEALPLLGADGIANLAGILAR